MFAVITLGLGDCRTHLLAFLRLAVVFVTLAVIHLLKKFIHTFLSPPPATSVTGAALSLVDFSVDLPATAGALAAAGAAGFGTVVYATTAPLASIERLIKSEAYFQGFPRRQSRAYVHNHITLSDISG